MKRKLFSVTLSMLFFVNLSVAQQTAALHSNGTVTFFPNTTGFTAAVNAAADGDTIYLSGGIFAVSNLNIGKKLTIFGVGHTAQSLVATGMTQINGNINLITGADFTSISGLFVNGNVSVGTTATNQNVSQVTIKRCHINGMLRLTFNGDELLMGSNFMLFENVIETLNGQYIRNCLIRQNIIGRLYFFRDNNQFINNIILRTSEYISGYYTNITGSHFENNVFIHLQYNSLEIANIRHCTFHQNAFVANATFGTTNTTIPFFNLTNQGINSIFVNYDGETTFSYDYDFNLKEGFAGIGYGKDEFDVGIYGTLVPFKENMLPQIPHIKSQTIATSTNSEGKLQVAIEVEAQER